MNAPRRSREVHAERVDVTRVPAGTFDTMPVAEGGLVVWGGQTEGESYIPLCDKPHPNGLAQCGARLKLIEGGYAMGAADCVCEEPCRYCKCGKP